MGWYWVSLCVLPVVVSQPGKYETRCGEVVEVYAIDSRYPHLVHGHYPSGIQESWHESGRIFAGRETDNDIIRPLTPA